MTKLGPGELLGDELVADPTLQPRQEPAGGSSSALGTYQTGFDGLKAIAMGVILAYHSGIHWTRGAFLGLSQFFTLSGFLITSMLIRSHDRGGIDLRLFWSRRLRRLMPAALACLFGVLVFGATVADRNQAEHLPLQVLAAATYWVNWLFVITKTSYVAIFASPSPLQHYWSLSVEEQFYLLMPVGMYVLLRRTRSTAVLAAVFTGGAVLSTAWMIYLYQTGAGLDRVYYGTDTRMAEMLVGGLLAVILSHTGLHFRERTRTVMAAVAAVAFAFSIWALATVPLADGPIWRGGMLGYSVVSCALLLGVLCDRGPVARLYSWGPLPPIGRITYGLYLYHWPIFLWLSPERTGLAPWPLFLLRTALTGMVATASYHFLEMPIRDGALFGLRGKTRLLVAPAVVVVLVGGSFITVDRSAPDPLATLRDSDRSLTPPIQAADGVLDILIITDETGPGVVSRIAQIAKDRKDVRVVSRTTFACPSITQRNGHPICSNWASRWPGLIARQDPDIVLFYVGGWPDAELTRLSGLGPAGLAPFAEQVLANGFDLLSAGGAPILFAAPGASFGVNVVRSSQPFYRAMSDLETKRTDLRHVLGGRLPEADQVPRAQFVSRSAEALLTDASLYQRADRDRMSKVMVLGDSQARSLGYGLERWGAQESKALVWNIATEGCGVAVDGVIAGQIESPVAPQCRAAVHAYADRIATFDPDVVVVLTSLWDLQRRRLPQWKTFHDPGDAAYDRYLVDSFTRTVDVLSAKGAEVVWVNAPCIDLEAPGHSNRVGAPNTHEFKHFNDVVLPAVVRQRPKKVSVFDLDAVLCPGGRAANDIDGVSPIRVDGVHFSVDGSLWFAAKHGPDLLRLGRR